MNQNDLYDYSPNTSTSTNPNPNPNTGFGTSNYLATNPESNCVYVNESTQSIYFNGGVNVQTMNVLIEKLIIMEQQILKASKKTKRKYDEISKNVKDDLEKDGDDSKVIVSVNIEVEPKPIMLYITSNGGLLHQVFSAIDTIRGLRVPVHTVCKGMVASAGTLLSLAGKKRFMTKNAYMLIHELRSGHYGKYTHLSESYENSKQMMEHIREYYLTNTKLTVEDLDSQLPKDLYWTPAKCLEKGLIDEII